MKTLSLSIFLLPLFYYPCLAGDDTVEKYYFKSAQDEANKSKELIASDSKLKEEKKIHKMLLSHVDHQNFKESATIQILNKITSSVYGYTIKINKKFIFDNLYFTVSKCWQAPSDQVPESKILIDIYTIGDEKEGGSKKSLFYGWLFASAPSSSGLEHPIYDVTAINCL